VTVSNICGIDNLERRKSMPPKIEPDGYQWPDSINVIGWSGVGINVYNGLIPKLCKATGMRPRIAHTVDSLQRFKYTKLGLFDLTAGGTTEVSLMLEGIRRFAYRDTGPFPIRTIWVQTKTNSGIVVRGDSYIKDIYDIKPGVRVVDMSGYVAAQHIQEASLAWAGIKDFKNDVVWVPATSSEDKVRLIVEGKADMTNIVCSTVALQAAEKNPYGLRWIDTNEGKDPEGAARYRAQDPLVDFGPMFSGPPSCIGHYGTVGTSFYVGHERLDPDYVYHLAKWFDENYEEFKDGHPWLKWMTRQTLIDGLQHTFYPVHEGCKRYLKEIGVWTDKHERRNQKSAELIDRYCQANEDAIRAADQKGMFVSAKNPEWITFWENFKKERGLPKFKMYINLEED
jgi:hypothetical protein